MGEFNAGKWILALSIYFIALFTITLAAINIGTEYDVDSSGMYAKGDFGGETDPGGFANVTLDDATSSNMDTVFGAIGFLTGFGSDKIGLGTPAAWNWLISFFLFYLPLVALIWALYMALPFLH